MDLRKYGTMFIRPDEVREDPRQETILHVYIDEKFDQPVLEFESGDQFSLNKTNTRILSKAYGWESKDLLGQVIELSLGHYMDWKTDPPQEKETVVVRPVSVRQPSPDNSGTKAQPMSRPSVRDVPSDDIPF
jgi:hypothetical protein